jgi:hypothetical protein
MKAAILNKLGADAYEGFKEMIEGKTKGITIFRF